MLKIVGTTDLAPSRTSPQAIVPLKNIAWITSLKLKNLYMGKRRFTKRTFNGGGRIGMSASRSGGTSLNQNTDWTNLLSAMGDVYIDYQTAGGSPEQMKAKVLTN